MTNRNCSKPEQQMVLIAIVFTIAGGGLIFTTFASINQVALAQEEQATEQQQPSTLNNTIASSSPPTTGVDNETSTISSTDNQSEIDEPLPSPTETSATTLSGELGSIQSAHQGVFSWIVSGDWVIQLDGPLAGPADPQIELFNATIHMARLDGNILHKHEIYNFNQSSVTHLGDELTTFNGTMTVTLVEGPIENVTGYVQVLGDTIAIWIDPRAVDEHFGLTPIHGIILPREEIQVSESE